MRALSVKAIIAALLALAFGLGSTAAVAGFDEEDERTLDDVELADDHDAYDMEEARVEFGDDEYPDDVDPDAID